MTASAANGFMNTSISTCAGTPYTFHAEYSTASQQNQVPWAALEGGVLMQQEIGHAEVCASPTTRTRDLRVRRPTDKQVFDTCVGGSEGARARRAKAPATPTTGVCTGAETEGTTGPIACPSNSIASGQLCEYADGNCYPQGNRKVISTASRRTEPSPVNFCQDNRFQRTVTWTSTVFLTRGTSGRMDRRTTRPRSDTPGRSTSQVSRTRRCSSRPTSAARSSSATSSTA